MGRAEDPPEESYCSRFAERGWVYDGGTLSIEAFKWIHQGSEEECAEEEAVPEGEPPKPARAVPCEELGVAAGRRSSRIVRRSSMFDEARFEYIEELRRRHGDVECEDGTPLAELGAPAASATLERAARGLVYGSEVPRPVPIVYSPPAAPP